MYVYSKIFSPLIEPEQRAVEDADSDFSPREGFDLHTKLSPHQGSTIRGISSKGKIPKQLGSGSVFQLCLPQERSYYNKFAVF